MTGAEFSKLMVLLDSLWGGVDEVREAGYRFLLEDKPYELCEQAVAHLARGDGRPPDELKWLPKPSELFARVVANERINELLQRGAKNAERLAAGPAPRLRLTTNQPTQEDHNGNPQEGPGLLA